MEIQKLNWAGIKLTTSGKVILIDAVEDFSAYEPALGKPKDKTITFSNTLKADFILFTHLHFDHFDLGLISKCLQPTGKVIAFASLVEELKELASQVEVIFLNLDEVYTESGIIFKPVFAMDGIGDKQCSWIVEGGRIKIFHGGDTIWHNQFWRLGKENQAIDYAFLPANGVTVNFTVVGLEYSPILASMNLEQAFAAAKLLHAKKLIPIHYGLFDQEPYYIPTSFTSADVKNLADSIEQEYLLLEDGQQLESPLL